LRNTTSFGYDNPDHLTSITDAAKPTAGVTRQVVRQWFLFELIFQGA